MKCPQQESKRCNERWYATTTWSHRVLWHHIQSTSHHQDHHCCCYTLNEYVICLKFNFETPLSTQNAKPPCLFSKSIHYEHLHISNNWPLSIANRYLWGRLGFAKWTFFWLYNEIRMCSLNQIVYMNSKYTEIKYIKNIVFFYFIYL